MLLCTYQLHAPGYPPPPPPPRGDGGDLTRVGWGGVGVKCILNPGGQTKWSNSPNPQCRLGSVNVPHPVTQTRGQIPHPRVKQSGQTPVVSGGGGGGGRRGTPGLAIDRCIRSGLIHGDWTTPYVASKQIKDNSYRQYH